MIIDIRKSSFAKALTDALDGSDARPSQTVIDVAEAIWCEARMSPCFWGICACADRLGPAILLYEMKAGIRSEIDIGDEQTVVTHGDNEIKVSVFNTSLESVPEIVATYRQRA